MGLLIEGQWADRWYDTKKTGGAFVREDARFRSWITADGAPGPTGEGGFPAAAGRYHLYVSYACPWAHRTLIVRRLKGLSGMIDLSVVNWKMGREGWTFEPGPGVIPDPLLASTRLHRIYTEAAPRYTGRVTVPVLWDRERHTIVSNESSEILRMFNGAFDHLGAVELDLYPEPLREAIDALNARIYATVNDGVYRAGFATSQSAYESAVRPLFETLDFLEERLSRSRYLLGEHLTEADVRLFTTLVRFDPVYHYHFKCNLRRLTDYPSLWGFTRDLYQQPGIRDTVHFDHIKGHYYQSHESINPHGVVPLGPELDFDAPHGRG